MGRTQKDSDMVLPLKRIKGVLSASGPKRYMHFIGVATDREQVWALYKNGFATISDGEGKKIFPVWAEADYAILCASGDWADYESRAIILGEFFDVFLENFRREGTKIAVMMTPDMKGPVVDADQLEQDLREGLLSFE